VSSSAVTTPESATQPSASWRYAVLGGLALVVVIADQATKALARGRLGSGGSFPLLGGAVDIVYARNTGAAFSLLQSRDSLFVVVAILVIGGIVMFYRRATDLPPIVQIGLGLILGGALGNLIDRIRQGYVADLVDLHWWPVFNVADSCIVSGVAALVLQSYLQDRKNRRNERTSRH
jgi:signal peptidase II